MTEPNATNFELHKWYQYPDKTEIYTVKWENAWAFEDEDGDVDDDEQTRDFATLDEALAFGKQLITAEVDC